MEFLFISLLLASTITTLLIFIKSKDLLHPSILSYFFLGIPIFLSSLRLSNLQSEQWSDKTYVVLSFAVITFIIIPSLFTWKSSSKADKYEGINEFLKRIKPSLILLLNLIVWISFFIENYLGSGSFFPFINAENTIHTVSYPGLSIITRSLLPLMIVFNYLTYKKTNKKIYLLFAILMMFSPALRLARFDIVISLILFIGLMFDMSKNKFKFIIVASLFIFILAIGGSALGQYRMTHGYKYDISYAEGIEYSGVKGPFEVFAFFYGYFPLSVENLDRFIVKNYEFEDYQYGAFLLRPITAGILQFNNIFSEYPMYEFLHSYSDPLIGYATVPTALPEFIMDFGFSLSFIPMLIYSVIGMYFYLKSQKKLQFRIYYLIYSQCLILFSFQNLFIESKIWYQIIMACLIFWFINLKKPVFNQDTSK